MTNSPEDQAKLTESILGDIQKRKVASQAEHRRLNQMTPEERKLDLSVKRAERLPHSSEVVSDIEVQKQQTAMKIRSSRKYKIKKITRGDLKLHGSVERTRDSEDTS